MDLSTSMSVARRVCARSPSDEDHRREHRQCELDLARDGRRSYRRKIATVKATSIAS